jgi:amicyanin
MNAKIVGVVLGILILVGIALAVMWPKETVDDSQQAATPSQPQTAQTTTDPGKQAASSEVNVDIKGFAFTQKDITVKKGTKVTWTNQDSVKHDVVSDDGAPAGGPKGPLLAKGESYSFTFDTVGTFPYHCTPHTYMKAVVTVTE